MACADAPFQRLIRKVVMRSDRQMDRWNTLVATYLARFSDAILAGNPLGDPEHIWTAEDRAAIVHDFGAGGGGEGPGGGAGGGAGGGGAGPPGGGTLPCLRMGVLHRPLLATMVWIGMRMMTMIIVMMMTLEVIYKALREFTKFNTSANADIIVRCRSERAFDLGNLEDTNSGK